MKKEMLLSIAAILLVIVQCAPMTQAQERNANAAQSSDLSFQNQSRVAASAADVKAVMLKDSGLIVELEHWVAKDATDHGQMVSDSDLTDDTIFDRLESDISFRAVVTLLVQRYGYLLPKFNPESERGKERELLIQERTKWLAQHQEEELAAARQRNARNFQNSQNVRVCDPQTYSDCEAPQSDLFRSSEGSQGRQGPAGPSSPSATPDQSNPPTPPRDDDNPLQRGRLMQTGGENLGDYPPDQLGNRGYSAQFFFNDLGDIGDSGAAGSLEQLLANGQDRQSSSRFGEESLQDKNDRNARPGSADGIDRLGTAFGNAGQNGGREANSNMPPGMSAVVPVQPSTRRYQRNALIQPAEMMRKQTPYDNIPSLYDMYV